MTDDDKEILKSNNIGSNILPSLEYEWIHKWLAMTLKFIHKEKEIKMNQITKNYERKDSILKQKLEKFEHNLDYNNTSL